MKSIEQEHLALKLRVGAIIKFLRMDLGLNQEKFGEIIEASRSYIAKLETGATGVSFIKLIQIARALKVDVSTLMIGAPCKESLNIILGIRKKRNLTRIELGLLCKRCAANDIPNREHILNIADGIKK